MEYGEIIKTQTTENPEAFSSEKARRHFISPRVRNTIATAIMLGTTVAPPLESGSITNDEPKRTDIGITAPATIMSREFAQPHQTTQAVSRQAEQQELIAQEIQKEEAKKEQARKAQAKREAKANRTPGSVKNQARDIVGNDQQFKCFDKIVDHESSWNYKATNPESGAYGLVQALPGSKMASEGPDWKTNPRTQIKWGLNYMNERYGSPCDAWEFWQKNSWY